MNEHKQTGYDPFTMHLRMQMMTWRARARRSRDNATAERVEGHETAALLWDEDADWHDRLADAYRDML